MNGTGFENYTDTVQSHLVPLKTLFVKKNNVTSGMDWW
jgi:hypothetical protein